MKSFATRRLATLALSLLLSLGCAYKAHLRAGDSAMAMADYDRAAQEYAVALQLEPDKPEIREKLERAQAGQVEQRAARARDLLTAGDDAGAVRLAAEAHGILPDSPATQTLVDEVVTATSARARASVQAGHFAEAMEVYDAILIGLPAQRPRIEVDLAATVDAWVAQLDGAASVAESGGHAATALLCRAKIAQLRGGDDGQRDRLRGQVDTEMRYVVGIRSKAGDRGARAVGDSLVGPRGSANMEVARDVAAARATMKIAIGQPRFDSQQDRRTTTARYQSGTQQVANPFHQSALNDVLAEERRLVDAENEVTQQEEYVSQYTADVAREGDTPGTTTGAEQDLSNAQSRLTSARRSVESQRSTVMRAKERLADTPPTREEPVYSTLSYTIVTHTRTASIDVRASIDHGDGRPGIVVEQPLEVAASDEENDAQPIAGVPADPLQLPSDREFTDQLHAGAAELLDGALASSFDGYRQAGLAQARAASGPARLEGLVRHVLTDPLRVDPSVEAAIFSESGVPRPAELLR